MQMQKKLLEQKVKKGKKYLGVKILVRYNKSMKYCPKTKHFHVACIDVMEENDFNFIFEVSDPNSALSRAIQDLPDSWEGSIEVNDHKTMAPNQMPLLDFWRTPSKK